MSTQGAFWKSSKGEIAINDQTKMPTEYLKNCIAKVEGELKDTTVSNRSEKEKILSEMQSELSSRESSSSKN